MSRPRKKTTSQVLEALAVLIGQLGMPPTIAELRKYLKVGSNRTVVRYLGELENEGLIERWAGARGIRILVEDDDECPWCGRSDTNS
jgi:SOS-response transcriptional repressor LexA